MKRQYIKPSATMVAVATQHILAGSDPKAWGEVVDKDGKKISGGNFGYGGDGSDGDVADSKGCLPDDDWGDLW